MTATIISEITLLELIRDCRSSWNVGCYFDANRVSDDSEGKRVKKVCAFWDERWCKNRSITDVDWSPKVRFGSLTSFNF